MKKYQGPGDTTNRHALLDWFTEKGMPLSTQIQHLEVMDGKTNEEKELLAKEILERLQKDSISTVIELEEGV